MTNNPPRQYKYWQESKFEWVCGYCNEVFPARQKVAQHCSSKHREKKADYEEAKDWPINKQKEWDD